MSDDVYYLRKARELTAASDDPSTKVGVVIVSNDARHVSFRKTVFETSDFRFFHLVLLSQRFSPI